MTTSFIDKFLSRRDPLFAYGDITLGEDATHVKKDPNKAAFEIVDFVLQHFEMQEAGPFIEGAKLNERYLQVKDLYLSAVNQVLENKPLESDEIVRNYLSRFSAYADKDAIEKKLIEDACNAHDELISFPHVYKMAPIAYVDLPKRIDEGVPKSEYDTLPKTLSKIFHKHIAHFDGEKWVVWKTLAEEWGHQNTLNPFIENLTYRNLMPIRYGEPAPEGTFRQFVCRKTADQLEACLGLLLSHTGRNHLEQITEKERIQIVFFLAHPDYKQKKACKFMRICQKVHSLKEELPPENCQILLNWLFDEMDDLPENWEDLRYTNEAIEQVKQIQEFLPQETDPKGISFYALHESFKNLELFLYLARTPYFEPQYEQIIMLLAGVVTIAAKDNIEGIFQYFKENKMEGRSPNLLLLPLIDLPTHFKKVKRMIEKWTVQMSAPDVVAVICNFHHCIGASKIDQFLEAYSDEIKKEIYVGPLPGQLVGSWDFAKNSIGVYRKRYSLGAVEFIRVCLNSMSTRFHPIEIAHKLEEITGKNLEKAHIFSILELEVDSSIILKLLKDFQSKSLYEKRQSLKSISDLLSDSPVRDAIMIPLQERVEGISIQPVS